MTHSSNPATRHGQWRSTFAFVMATTGAAVGLGNIWKFPHMVGDHGGSAFVLIYLICVLVIGLPTMMSEVLIGRIGRKNPVDSLMQLAKENRHSPWWGLLGWVGAVSLFCILSFYSVVAGWSVGYFFMALKGQFNQTSPADIQDLWSQFVSSPSQLLLWHSIFMIMTLVVVARGVEKGIEKASKILMPVLFLILLILAVYGALYGDMQSAITFLFSFDVSQLSPSVVLSALGHAFFTLALGAGALLVYGAYLPQSQRSLGRTLTIVALLDTLVALLAGLAIFPIVFQYQLEPAEGYGLMYKILPISFSSLPGGQWVGASFFLLLVFAAWTSTFSIAEPLVMLAIEKLNVSRIKASLMVGSACWIMGIGALLSFNVWSEVYLIKDWNIFSILTIIPLNLLLPLGGIGFALFAGWVIKPGQSQEIFHLNPLLFKAWRLVVRYIAPAAIAIIMIVNLFE